MQVIEKTKHDAILELKLNSGAANVLTHEAFIALQQAFSDIDKDIKVLMMTSAAEGYFSNGLDPDMFIGKSKEEIAQTSELILTVARQFLFLPLPAISVISGHTMGAGSVFALFSDFCYMAKERARIGYPEVLIGMSFPAFASAVLRDKTSGFIEKELLLTGKAVKGPEAKNMGLVTEVVDNEKLYDFSMKKARSLSRHSRTALQNIKQSSNYGYLDLAERFHARDLQQMVNIITSEAGQEGFMALKENRRPAFKD